MDNRMKLLVALLVGAIVAALQFQVPAERPMTLEEAVAGLKAPDDLDRAHAALVLANMEPPPLAALQPLLAALADDDFAVRLSVTKALRRIGTPAVTGLIKIMEAKGRPAYSAAETLGAMGEAAASAIPALGATTRAGKEAPIHAATEALEKFGERGMKELIQTYRQGTGAEHWMDERIEAALGTYGALVVPYFIDDLGSDDYARANKASGVLGRVAVHAVPRLLEILKSGPPRRQEAALYVLMNGKVKLECVRAAIAPLTKSQNESLRDTATRALSELGEP